MMGMGRRRREQLESPGSHSWFPASGLCFRAGNGCKDVSCTRIPWIIIICRYFSCSVLFLVPHLQPLLFQESHFIFHHAILAVDAGHTHATEHIFGCLLMIFLGFSGVSSSSSCHLLNSQQLSFSSWCIIAVILLPLISSDMLSRTAFRQRFVAFTHSFTDSIRTIFGDRLFTSNSFQMHIMYSHTHAINTRIWHSCEPYTIWMEWVSWTFWREMGTFTWGRITGRSARIAWHPPTPTDKYVDVFAQFYTLRYSYLLSHRLKISLLPQTINTQTIFHSHPL